MDLFDRMLELSGQGFYCAQILMILALESEEKEDPDLIRAMGGLNGGLGFSGRVCGALTGGCCFLSYFLGKGEAEEMEDPQAALLIGKLAEWFEETTKSRYGGCSCREILDGDPRNKIQRCPELVEAARSWWKQCITNVWSCSRKKEGFHERSRTDPGGRRIQTDGRI